MKTTVLILAMVALFIQSVFSQGPGSVRGTVLEKATGNPMPGVNVYIEVNGSKQGTVTDFNGDYHLKSIIPGTYSVNYSLMGMESVKVINVNVKGGAITSIDKVLLKDAVITLGGEIGYEVIGYKRPIMDVENPVVKGLTAGEFENIPGGRDISKIITTISPEIQVPENGRGIMVRGSRPGTSQYVVDGVKTDEVTTGIPSAAIQNFIVYTGGIPARYGDVTGGLIVIETKSYFDYLSAFNSKKEKAEQNALE